MDPWAFELNVGAVSRNLRITPRRAWSIFHPAIAQLVMERERWPRRREACGGSDTGKADGRGDSIWPQLHQGESEGLERTWCTDRSSANSIWIGGKGDADGSDMFVTKRGCARCTARLRAIRPSLIHQRVCDDGPAWYEWAATAADVAMSRACRRCCRSS